MYDTDMEKPTYQITHFISPAGIELLEATFAKPREVDGQLVWDVLPDWLKIMKSLSEAKK